MIGFISSKTALGWGRAAMCKFADTFMCQLNITFPSRSSPKSFRPVPKYTNHAAGPLRCRPMKDQPKPQAFPTGNILWAKPKRLCTNHQTRFVFSPHPPIGSPPANTPLHRENGGRPPNGKAGRLGPWRDYSSSLLRRPNLRSFTYSDCRDSPSISAAATRLLRVRSTAV